MTPGTLIECLDKKGAYFFVISVSPNAIYAKCMLICDGNIDIERVIHVKNAFSSSHLIVKPK